MAMCWCCDGSSGGASSLCWLYENMGQINTKYLIRLGFLVCEHPGQPKTLCLYYNQSKASTISSVSAEDYSWIATNVLVHRCITKLNVESAMPINNWTVLMPWLTDITLRTNAVTSVEWWPPNLKALTITYEELVPAPPPTTTTGVRRNAAQLRYGALPSTISEVVLINARNPCTLPSLAFALNLKSLTLRHVSVNVVRAMWAEVDNVTRFSAIGLPRASWPDTVEKVSVTLCDAPVFELTRFAQCAPSLLELTLRSTVASPPASVAYIASCINAGDRLTRVDLATEITTEIPLEHEAAMCNGLYEQFLGLPFHLQEPAEPRVRSHQKRLAIQVTRLKSAAFVMRRAGYQDAADFVEKTDFSADINAFLSHRLPLYALYYDCHALCLTYAFGETLTVSITVGIEREEILYLGHLVGHPVLHTCTLSMSRRSLSVCIFYVVHMIRCNSPALKELCVHDNVYWPPTTSCLLDALAVNVHLQTFTGPLLLEESNERQLVNFFRSNSTLTTLGYINLSNYRGDFDGLARYMEAFNHSLHKLWMTTTPNNQHDTSRVILCLERNRNYLNRAVEVVNALFHLQVRRQYEHQQQQLEGREQQKQDEARENDGAILVVDECEGVGASYRERAAIAEFAAADDIDAAIYKATTTKHLLALDHVKREDLAKRLGPEAESKIRGAYDYVADNYLFLTGICAGSCPLPADPSKPSLAYVHRDCLNKIFSKLRLSDVLVLPTRL